MKDLTLPIIVNLLFWGLALAWVLKLEKKQCGCSKDWRRDYMKYFFMAVIALQFVILSGKEKLIKYASAPVGLATLVYIGVSISYIDSQRKKRCDCSKSNERMVLFAFSIVQAAFISWAVFKKLKAAA
jgi:hypothetical protein